VAVLGSDLARLSWIGLIGEEQERNYRNNCDVLPRRKHAAPAKARHPSPYCWTVINALGEDTPPIVAITAASPFAADIGTCALI